jgi:hypothetical protein
MIYEGINGSGGSLTGVENPRKQAKDEWINSRLEYRGVKQEEQDQYSTATDIYEEIKNDLYGHLDLQNEEIPNQNNYYNATMRRYTDYQHNVEEDQKEELYSNIFKVGALAGLGFLVVKFM